MIHLKSTKKLFTVVLDAMYSTVPNFIAKPDQLLSNSQVFYWVFKDANHLLVWLPTGMMMHGTEKKKKWPTVPEVCTIDGMGVYMFAYSCIVGIPVSREKKNLYGVRPTQIYVHTEYIAAPTKPNHPQQSEMRLCYKSEALLQSPLTYANRFAHQAPHPCRYIMSNVCPKVYPFLC